MKLGKLIYKVFTTLITIIMIALAVLLVGFRLVGFTPYSVLSPSMTPKYPVGALIYVKEIPHQDIVVGDDITFVLDESLTVVTHQVVGIDEDHEFFTTQGLANDAPDGAPVYYENILGKAHFGVPMLGYISDVVTSPLGLIISISLILMWAIIIYMIDLVKQEKKEANETQGKKRGKHAQDKAKAATAATLNEAATAADD